MSSFGFLKNVYLRSLVEATDDEEEKKKKEKEKKNGELGNGDGESDDRKGDEKSDSGDGSPGDRTDETDAESGGTDDASSSGSDQENGAGDVSENEAPPPDDTDASDGGEDDSGGDMEGSDEGSGEEDGEIDPDSVTDVDGSGDDFSLDGDGDGGDENPDGIPSPDDDGSGDSAEDGETNLQVNILKLSKLDRALAKRNCFDYFSSLKYTIQTTLNMIDKSETVLDANIRQQAIEDLNDKAEAIQTYLQYKFPVVNYEEALNAYYTFVQEIDLIIKQVRNNGITSTGRRKPNKDT